MMALIRNKTTGELIKCSEFEAKVLTCPQRFKDWMNKALAEKKYVASLDQIQLDVDKTEIYFKVDKAKVPIKKVLNSEYEELPDTEASNVLYGEKA
jgi:hypothetical protein